MTYLLTAIGLVDVWPCSRDLCSTGRYWHIVRPFEHDARTQPVPILNYTGKPKTIRNTCVRTDEFRAGDGDVTSQVSAQFFHETTPRVIRTDFYCIQTCFEVVREPFVCDRIVCRRIQ